MLRLKFAGVFLSITTVAKCDKFAKVATKFQVANLNDDNLFFVNLSSVHHYTISRT